METREATAMVVTQGGAAAARDVLASLGDRVVTVTQKDKESLEALGQRVRKAVAYVESHDCPLTIALFVARPGFDVQDIPAAADLVRAVVSHMVGAGSGQVHLQAANSQPQSRYALTALADAISDQVRSTGVQVVVRDPEPSTVFVLEELRKAASA
jgi:hypothetical protein